MRSAVRLPSLALALGAALLLWGALFLLLPPARQDFPLNDDWGYSRGAFAFAQGQGIHYFGWAAMPLLGQWLWVAPFVWAFGMSHAALRGATLLLSCLGTAAFVSLLRQEGIPERRAAFLGACLALNPLFFLMAGTFMSDVPALAFSLIALALYANAIRTGKGAALAAAAAAAILAVTTRQNAIAVPITAAWLLRRSPRLRARPLWILGVIGPAVVCLLAQAWFSRRPDALRFAPSLAALRHTPLLAFAGLHLLGLSVLPALLLLRPFRAPGWRGAAAVLGLLASAAVFSPRLFPYLGNMITEYGQFYSGDVVLGARPLLMGPGIRGALTLAGCLGGAWLLVRLSRASAGPILIFTAAHAALLAISPALFDRYLLTLLPGALYAAGGTRKSATEYAQPPLKVRRVVAGLVLVVCGVLSLALAHDWLSWNAARWELGRRALARGIPPLDIEGGFEWDGWFSPGGAAPREASSPQGLSLPFTGRLFPGLTGRYALAFSVPRGCVPLDAEPYRLWLIPGRHRFFLVASRQESARR